MARSNDGITRSTRLRTPPNRGTPSDGLIGRGFAVFVNREAIVVGQRWSLEFNDALDKKDFFVPPLAPGKRGWSMTPVPGNFPIFWETQMVLLHTSERRDNPLAWRREVERLVGGIFGIALPGLTA